MAETTGNDDLAAAVRDRGMEHLEGAKGQLAEGAERVAAAVDRTAEQLEEDGDNAISGFGHSVASLMRQLAGGLRERDVEDFARELATLARRNPGVFLAGSVALGFGIARFFKARSPQSSQVRGDEGGQSTGGSWGTRESTRPEREYDAEERLDLSANSTQRRDSSQDNASKSRSTKHKAKPQRASTPREQQPSSAEPSAAESTSPTATADSKDNALTGGTGGGTLRGGKS